MGFGNRESDEVQNRPQEADRKSLNEDRTVELYYNNNISHTVKVMRELIGTEGWDVIDKAP